MSIIYELRAPEIRHKIKNSGWLSVINLFFVVFSFSLAFICVAEIMYWLYKKEYLRAKAKYLRELIEQKNNLNSLNEPFYACVYEKWSSGEMPLTEANILCSLQFERN